MAYLSYKREGKGFFGTRGIGQGRGFETWGWEEREAMSQGTGIDKGPKIAGDPRSHTPVKGGVANAVPGGRRRATCERFVKKGWHIRMD